MKKQLLLLGALLVAAIAFPASVSAQSYEDVVHLKNGSVIRGVIVEQVPGTSLKIETRDGNIFVYQMGEVEKMTKEMGVSRSSRTGRSVGGSATRLRDFNKPRGYMGLVEVGGGLGLGNYAAQRVSVSMINGYRVLPQFAVGVGVGAEMFFYTWGDYNGNVYTGPELSMPVFLHLRSDFIDGKVSPYVAVNAGYNVSLSGGFIGGLMLDPSVGVGFNVGRKSRMLVGVGYALNRVKYYYGYYEQTGMAGGLKLKVGLSF